VLRPRARSSKFCGAPSQPTRPSINDATPSGTVPTQAAVSANSAGLYVNEPTRLRSPVLSA
jgi:hypothetical protein